MQVFVDRDESQTFEDSERVCETLTWDDLFTLPDRTLTLRYGPTETPCPDISLYERWGVRATGYFALSVVDPLAGGPPAVTMELTADINDGASVVISDPVSGAETCRLELWSDVPEYDNYHSTDALDLDHGCRADITAEVPYPVVLEFYHQGDPASPNSLFNRANLSVYHSGFSRELRPHYLRD